MQRTENGGQVTERLSSDFCLLKFTLAHFRRFYGTDNRKTAWFRYGADEDFGVFFGSSCFWVEKHSC